MPGAGCVAAMHGDGGEAARGNSGTGEDSARSLSTLVSLKISSREGGGVADLSPVFNDKNRFFSFFTILTKGRHT